MKKFKTYDNTILKLNKTYKWSGFSRNVNIPYVWNNHKCKIINIEDDKITVQDLRDHTIRTYSNDDLANKKITFKTRFSWIKKLFNI